MPQCLFRPLCGRVLVFVALLVALVAMFASPQWSHAQIATDGSLGPARTLSGKSVTIGSDLGQIRGANLFHSFLEFNVNTGQSVTFTGPTSIANILSRVTGGSPSTIDGLLRSTIPGANMFLLNPAGVLFGPNASLDIGGSFHVTTADYVRLRDGGVFHANLANQSVLSVASPAAFGFLGTSPAPIIVQGSALAVGAGRSISLVGGDVAVVNGLLAAPGGRISLVSVGGAGEATFNPATQTPDLSVRNGVPGGQVVLSNAGLLSDSDVRGGRILIRGGRLVSEASVGLVRNLGVEDGDPVGIDITVTNDVVLDGSALRTATLFARGGDIAVNARSIVVAGGGDIGTLSFGPGAAGAVRLSAETLDVRSDLSSIFSRSTATGDSGAISIVARLLNVDGGMIRSETADGRGGDVVIDAARVVLAAGGGVESFTTGSGTGASLTIRASESVTASGTSSLGLRSHVSSIGAGRGPAGPVTISTPMLAFDGADVSVLTSAGGGDIFLDVARAMLTANAFVSSINEGAAPGGNVTFIGSQSIRITGESSVGSFSAGSGLPGRLEIRVPVLSLENASNIGSPGTAARAGDVVVRVDELSILGGSQITTGTLGAGSGGTVTITARQSMTMAGRSDEGNQSNVNSITAGSGNAGDIAITTPALSMTDSASITTATVGPGKGGNVTVNVGRLRMSGDAFIDSTAISDGGPSTGPAGTVTVNASEAVSLARGAAITALTNNAANAGTVTVSAPTLSIAGDATITGTTAGAGRGGDIRVNVGQLQLSSGGSIDSTAQAAGRGGTVTVTADTASIIGRDPTSGRASRLSSNSQASGPGGDVVLRAGSILLQDGGSVQARAFGEGNAGNLTIAGDKLRSFGGSITTEAANGAGGNIVMRLTSLAQLVDSRVTTSVQGGFGSGGNITIAPRFLVLDGSEIRADAFGGPGGNVSLVADIFLSTDSVLSASSALGTPGVINVQAQITDVSGTLQSLPESVLQAATLLREACRVRAAEGPASSFVLGGRGGLPPAPGGLLPSPLLDDVPTASASMPAALSFSPIVLTANCR
jgi:filamentous hemagglutinin family protein